MAGVDAGLAGNVELNLGGVPWNDNMGAVPMPHHPAFWAHVFFLLAAGFLLVTYFGGFRRIGG